MKITKRQLKRIIREERQKLMRESFTDAGGNIDAEAKSNASMYLFTDLTDAIDNNEPVTGIIKEALADGFSLSEIKSLMSDAIGSANLR
tara:strand:- start:102 stop:368 length:267 start_codon:yes stop_codon:yes gene_type:complete